MKLIPALSMKSGRVAVADGGQYSFVKGPEGGHESPVSVLKEANLPGEEVFILDLDGIERNSPDLDAVKRVAAHWDVWLDAGTPDCQSMMDLFVSDASKVVMGTLSLDSLEELEEALGISGNVIFSVAHDGRVVSPDPKLSGKDIGQLLELLGPLDVQQCMLLDLGSVRNGLPVDTGPVSKLAERFPEVYVSGHIAREDLEGLESAGATGAIIDFRTLRGMQNG